MWRYDPVGKKYQSWYFLAPGGEAVQIKRKNAYEWTIIGKGKDGTVLNRMIGKQTRSR
jgi:hypothetical protein